MMEEELYGARPEAGLAAGSAAEARGEGTTPALPRLQGARQALSRSQADAQRFPWRGLFPSSCPCRSPQSPFVSKALELLPSPSLPRRARERAGPAPSRFVRGRGSPGAGSPPAAAAALGSPQERAACSCGCPRPGWHPRAHPDLGTGMLYPRRIASLSPFASGLCADAAPAPRQAGP